MNPDCQKHQEAMLSAATRPEHAARCGDCATFHTVARELAPPEELLSRTIERLRPLLVARAARRRELFWGLTLAGAFSLPFIVLLNAGMVWMSYAAIERLANPQLAAAGATVLAASLMLALAIAYGSLPLLANWGLQLRERTS